MIPGEGIGEFGDVRRAERGAWLFERIVATGSLVLRKVGGDRAGEIAAHRFLESGNPLIFTHEIRESRSPPGEGSGVRAPARRGLTLSGSRL